MSSTVSQSEEWQAVEGESKSGSISVIDDGAYTLELKDGRLLFNGEDYGAAAAGDTIEVKGEKVETDGKEAQTLSVFKNGVEVVGK